MDDHFASSRALVERARENLDEFNRRAIAFFQANPYTRFEELDPETGEYRHGIRMVAFFDPSVTVVAFDVVNNLRSALDHAVYGSAEALGYHGLTTTKFPFGNTEKAAKDDAKNCHPVEEIRTFLLSFKPYLGPKGNELLWGLNKLRNIKNHRQLLTPRFDVGNTTITGGVFTSGVTIAPEWNAAGNEYTYMRTGRQGETGYNLTVRPTVKFADIPALKDVHAPGMFNHLAGVIAGIIDGVEAETTRVLGERGS